MDFFDGVKSFASSLINTVTNFGSKIIDKVKSVFSNPDPKIEKDLNKVKEKIAKSAPVTEYSTPQRVYETQYDLSSYPEIYCRRAKEIEDVCIDYIDEYFTAIFREIEQYESIRKNIGLINLKKNKRKLYKKVEGSMVSVIEKRMSLDDVECREILRTYAGSTKARKLDDFGERVLRKAQSELIKNISEVLDEQTNDINSFLQEYIDERESSVARKKDEFEKWEYDLENNTFDKERAIVVPLYRLKVFDDIERKLGA